MNNTHEMTRAAKEEIKRQWWDGVLQGLAQRSGSAGNYIHNHIQCTSQACDFILSSPPITATASKSASDSLVKLYLCVCAEKMAKRTKKKWN